MPLFYHDRYLIAGLISKNARIGVISEIDENILHIHNESVFNSFSNKTDNHWSLNEFFVNTIKEELQRSGFEFVPVSTPPQLSGESSDRKSEVGPLIVNDNGQWIVPPKSKNLYEELLNRNIEALIVYISRPLASANFEGYLFESPSLYARGVFLLRIYSVVSPSHKGVYILNPKASLTPLYEHFAFDGESIFLTQSSQIKGFKPQNHKELNEEEWNIVEKSLKTLILRNIKSDIELLANRSAN